MMEERKMTMKYDKMNGKSEMESVVRKKTKQKRRYKKGR